MITLRPLHPQVAPLNLTRKDDVMSQSSEAVPEVSRAWTGTDPYSAFQMPDGRWVPLDKPWPLASQFWVALIGGILPAVVIAWLNAPRLKLSGSARIGMLLLGLLGMVLAVAVALWLIDVRGVELPRGKLLMGQLSLRLVGVGLFPLLAGIQAGSQRTYGKNVGVFGRLWAPGLIAVALLSPLSGFLVGWVVQRLSH